VQARTIGVALDDDGLGVIEEHVLGYPAEVVERLAQADAQRRRILAHGELHEAGAAVAHRRHQRDQRVAAPPHMGEVGLHLLAGRRLEAHDRACSIRPLR
jgi:hypothetical protein